MPNTYYIHSPNPWQGIVPDPDKDLGTNGSIHVLKSTSYNFVILAEKFLFHKIATALNQVRDKASRPSFSDVTNNQNPALSVTPNSPILSNVTCMRALLAHA